MSNQLIFTVEPGAAQRAKPVSLADAGLKERADLQEWVRANPEILGDNVRIVTFEFGRWQAGQYPMSTWRSGESSTQYGCRATKCCNTRSLHC